MIKVLLSDDQALVRGGFRMLIDAADDMDVVGEVADGAQAVEFVRRFPVDVVLMDIRMPVMDGTEATRLITQSAAETKVLVLTTFDLDEYVYTALRNGASGFLLKDAEPNALLDAIRAVAAGGAVMAPTATKRLLDHVASSLPSSVPDTSPLDVLTAREREVLEQVAKGLNNAEIAATLYLAEGTVKTHMGSLLAKLGARDRVGLVLIAHRCGLLK